jgi:hypothetical protein
VESGCVRRNTNNRLGRVGLALFVGIFVGYARREVGWAGILRQFVLRAVCEGAGCSVRGIMVSTVRAVCNFRRGRAGGWFVEAGGGARKAAFPRTPRRESEKRERESGDVRDCAN